VTHAAARPCAASGTVVVAVIEDVAVRVARDAQTGVVAVAAHRVGLDLDDVGSGTNRMESARAARRSKR
jgi:EAL domain-containing protein (putative c-di-GMP-specific phosphodiesterase class I)